MAENIISLSIITPCFNEEASVLDCASAVREIMASQLPNVTYEHIFIDNASTDQTVKVLRGIAASEHSIKVLVNSRNIGPFRNIYAAMSKASGMAIVPMLPADLQDPAELIPELYKEWEKGFLVVYGERTNRQEAIGMRLLRGLYYRIVKLMSETDIPINSGEFMLIDKKISQEICKLRDHYPYIRGLVAQSTSNSTSIPYTWRARKKGKSKANFLNLVDQAINGFVSTSRAPARLALLAGFVFASFGICAAVWSLIANIIDTSGSSNGIPTLIVTLFFFGGLQMFFLGLIGEYVLSIHSQVRRMPNEFIIEALNFDD